MATEDTAASDVTFRALNDGDYGRGFCELLGQLTVVGALSEQQFRERLEMMRASGLIHVVVGECAGRVVAAATLVVEPKFVHAAGFVGHVEDVVVDKTLRGRKLGERVIKECHNLAAAKGCYKVILDCSEANVGFYEKCGYRKKEVQMRYDIPGPAGL